MAIRRSIVYITNMLINVIYKLIFYLKHGIALASLVSMKKELNDQKVINTTVLGDLVRGY
jgi:hypothetical protein